MFYLKAGTIEAYFSSLENGSIEVCFSFEFSKLEVCSCEEVSFNESYILEAADSKFALF
jgi:hypothetical protein